MKTQAHENLAVEGGEQEGVYEWMSTDVLQHPDNYSPDLLVPCENVDLNKAPPLRNAESLYSCRSLPSVEEDKFDGGSWCPSAGDGLSQETNVIRQKTRPVGGKTKAGSLLWSWVWWVLMAAMWIYDALASLARPSRVSWLFLFQRIEPIPNSPKVDRPSRDRHDAEASLPEVFARSSHMGIPLLDFAPMSAVADGFLDSSLLFFTHPYAAEGWMTQHEADEETSAREDAGHTGQRAKAGRKRCCCDDGNYSDSDGVWNNSSRYPHPSVGQNKRRRTMSA